MWFCIMCCTSVWVKLVKGYLTFYLWKPIYVQIYKFEPIFMWFESCNSSIVPCTCHYTIVDRPITSTKMRCGSLAQIAMGY